MAGATPKIPASRRRRYFDEIIKFSGGPTSFTDVIFEFLEKDDESPENLYESLDYENYNENDENSCNVEENRAFWETQDQLLQATICKSSSVESRIRKATKEALREVNMAGVQCVCRRPVAGGCRNCLRREISIRLQNVGYNCAICKSKWRSSPDVPSGEHAYLEVVDITSKKGDVRVVIELNFRAEFEMARASEEYNRLISRLPEVFVCKAERLKALIKILCGAAKKSMKDKKMHLGPWRKHKYVQAKWLGGTYERTMPAVPLPIGLSVRPQPKPRASMLTFDLLDNLPGLHCTAVEVL